MLRWSTLGSGANYTTLTGHGQETPRRKLEAFCGSGRIPGTPQGVNVHAAGPETLHNLQ